MHPASLSFAGNWSPTDYPDGTSWEPYSKSHTSTNRDLHIVLEQPDLVAYFLKVYQEDWKLGKAWYPKAHAHRAGTRTVTCPLPDRVDPDSRYV